MDDQRFLRACELRDEGKLREAISEFLRIVSESTGSLDKAGVMLNVATTFKALGEYDQARQQLATARRFVSSLDESAIEAMGDSRPLQLEVNLDFEDADISSFEGQLDAAIAKFDLLLKKYGRRLDEREFRETY